MINIDNFKKAYTCVPDTFECQRCNRTDLTKCDECYGLFNDDELIYCDSGVQHLCEKCYKEIKEYWESEEE